MRLRIVSLIIAIGLATIVISLFIHEKQSKQNTPATTETAVNNLESAKTNFAPRPVSSSPSQTKLIQPVQATLSNQAPLTKEEKLEQLKQAMGNYSEQLHRPIVFYGMVVDESNAVVAGANIRFSWTHLMMPETSYETNAISDANGMFSLTGVVGATLNVDVSKDGYYSLKSLNPTSFSYSETFGSHPFQPNPNRPVVFHLKKKGQGVSLITSRQGMTPDFSFEIPRDGTPIFVDVLNRKVGNSGQIEISQIKPDPTNWRNATEWKFRMAIQDGGFIEENDEFPFEAPDSGYEPVLEFDFKQGDFDWTTSLKKNYYIKFGNPPMYGWLRLETFIDMSGARLMYAINPDGTQNLEPK